MTRLSLRTKLELIEYHEKKNATLMQTAKKFGTTITTVHKTLKNKCVWVKLYNNVKDGRCKQYSFSENAVIDSELAKWYAEIKSSQNFDGITRLELRKSLNKIVREHKIGFKVNVAWINEFVRKYEVVLKKVDVHLVAAIKKSTSKSERNGKITSKSFAGVVETKSKGKIVQLKRTKHVKKKDEAALNNVSASPAKGHKPRNIRENVKQGNIRTKNVLSSKSVKKCQLKEVQGTTRVVKAKVNVHNSEINKNGENSLGSINIVESSSLIQSSSNISAEVIPNVDDDNKLLLEALKIRRRTSLDKTPCENSSIEKDDNNCLKKKSTKSGPDGDKPLKGVSVGNSFKKKTQEDIQKHDGTKKSSKIRGRKSSPKKVASKGLENSKIASESTTERTLRVHGDNEPLEANFDILTSLKICRKTNIVCENLGSKEKLSANDIKRDNDTNKEPKSTKTLRKSSSPDKKYSKINKRGFKSIKANSLNKKFKTVPTNAKKIVHKNVKGINKVTKNETSDPSFPPKKSRNKPTKSENKLQKAKEEEKLLENNSAGKTGRRRKTNVDKSECQVAEQLEKGFNKLDETESSGTPKEIQESFENNTSKLADVKQLETTNDDGKFSEPMETSCAIKKPFKRKKTFKVVFNTGRHYRRFTRNSTKGIGTTTTKKPKRPTRTVQTKLDKITCEVPENGKLCKNDSEEIEGDTKLSTREDEVMDDSNIKTVDNNNEQNSRKTFEKNDENNKIKIKTCYSQANNIAERKVGTKRKRDVFEFDYDKDSEANHSIPSKKQKRDDNLTQNLHKSKRVALNASSRITRGRAENFEMQELLPKRRRKRKPRQQIEEPGNIVKLENFIDPIVMSTPLHHEINLSLNKIGFEENIISHTYKQSAKGNKKLHKTRKRRSLRINPATNSTTDDDDEQLMDETPKHRRTRRRRRKTNPLIIKADPTDLVPMGENVEQFGAFEEDADFASNELDYYETIENDNVVEILCNRNSTDSADEQPQKRTPKRPTRKPKIEILSDIKIISGSKNLIGKKTRSKSESTALNSVPPDESSEHVFKVPAARKTSLPETPASNCDVSWSNLFPDLDRTVSAEELVNQINEIEFQYDPDAFKNVKIEVLSSGCTDEDENNSLEYDDGAEGDDEFEDDDVPSSQGQQMPPPNQLPQPPPNSMQGGYRPPMPPNGRAPAPRGPQPGPNRMPGGPRPPMNNRAPGARPRAPMIRPRGAPGPQPIRGQLRPRMSGPQNGARPGNQTSPIKRTPDQNNTSLQKRKKVDVLAPSDKDDDDCQVICMQPKSTGLPQIESVQGASESVENSIMKLSDSITLSVRNPPPKQAASPQKSDAKAVANVLASRGITVTASGKPKDSPTKQGSAMPTALSLNGAVSIVAKNNSKPTSSESLPTVDLTDDSPSSQNSPNRNRPGLPYRCDLCPAQYPNAMGLNKHRQTYHKTTSGMCELGVPLINLKQPGIMQKLTQLGINNYIPLPSAGSEGTYALPIITTKNPGNVSALGASQMLSLGPVRAIPRPGAANNANNAIKK